VEITAIGSHRKELYSLGREGPGGYLVACSIGVRLVRRVGEAYYGMNKMSGAHPVHMGLKWHAVVARMDLQTRVEHSIWKLQRGRVG
jgi:hypothetical protein